MKKMLAFVLVAVCACTMFAPAGAASDSIGNADPFDERVLQYAYMDENVASPEMKEKILEAREVIIFSENWVADGYTGYIGNALTGEMRELPSFSELFPDWEIPVNDVLQTRQEQVPEIQQESPKAEYLSSRYRDWMGVFSGKVYLRVASTTSNASPFTHVYMDPVEIGSVIQCYATELTSSETCNIGFSDYNTGKSYLSGTNLYPYDYVILESVHYEDIGVRASTMSSAGWSSMRVYTANRITSVRANENK